MIEDKERVVGKSTLKETDEQMVWKFIVDERVVTLEKIIEEFPWIRWGDLFSIMGKFRREGILTFNQIDTILEVGINEHRFEMV